MDNPFQHLNAVYLIIVCSIVFGLSACENPGAVGSGLTDPGSAVVNDTLIVDGVQDTVSSSYSGELEFFSAGQYDDPLFGNMSVTGYLKPNLPAEGDTMRNDAVMLMRLMYNIKQAYGDTLATQGFDLYEIDQIWRDRAQTIDNELTLSQKLGEFTVGPEDSLTVNLSDMAPQWVDRYRSYAQADTADSSSADSTYIYEMHGLALVPNNSSKILPLYRDSTRFVIQHPEADTFDVSLNEWGYYLERDNNSSIPQNSVPLYSTYERVINFGDLGLSSVDVSPSGLSRAVLVLYENRTEMDQSIQSEPPATRRPKETTAYLHLVNPDNISENIDPGAPVDNILRVGGTYSENDNTYRFDITNLVDRIIRSGFPEEREFFVTLPNDGVIKPSLIFTDSDQTTAGYKPKVIITSLKNTNN